jgi:hypothetical protein
VDVHLSLKYSGLYGQITLSEKRNKEFIKLPGEIRRSSFVESRPAPSAAISVKGELRHNEQAAFGVQNAAIHPAEIIRKYSKVDDFVSKILGALFCVVRFDPDE